MGYSENMEARVSWLRKRGERRLRGFSVDYVYDLQSQVALLENRADDYEARVVSLLEEREALLGVIEAARDVYYKHRDATVDNFTEAEELYLADMASVLIERDPMEFLESGSRDAR